MYNCVFTLQDTDLVRLLRGEMHFTQYPEKTRQYAKPPFIVYSDYNCEAASNLARCVLATMQLCHDLNRDIMQAGKIVI